MDSNQIRKKFLNFFEKRNHFVLDSAPLVTKDQDGSINKTLFNTAGVQPIIPYLLGEKEHEYNRLASSQKCLRTTDIDDVGDNTHLTFFEMLGNWSIGDYFKKEAIEWSYEFLTSKDEGLGLDPNRLYITCFAGNENSPKDTESAQFWEDVGIPKDRIYFLGADSNWWPNVKGNDNWTGPTGPSTEMFYDLTENGLGELSHEEFLKADEDQKIVEVWNDVFMQYEKVEGKIVGNLSRHAVDTGAGLERLTVVVNKKDSIFDTDLFTEVIDMIKKNSKNFNEEKARIVADHIKSSTFIIAEDVMPSNTDRGYILRRLLRKAIILSDQIGFNKLPDISDLICEKYKETYSELSGKEKIRTTINEEAEKFRKTIKNGLKEFNRQQKSKITGKEAFLLFSTYGFPIELITDLAEEKGIEVDLNGFEEEMEKHKEKSRTAAEGKFKGGLQSSGEIETKYHTATHLLHQALRDVLGDHVSQKGSNINADRLRFDFSHDSKITDEEKAEIERIVNQKIEENLPVNRTEMDHEDALKTGALHFFADKYGDKVSIYYIGDSLDDAYSKEFCGGPHVENTRDLGKFRIKKEEASSAGVRRIKAVLE